MGKGETIGKLILGIILLVAGLWLILPLNLGPYSGAGWSQFLTVLIGTVPALIALIGILLVWIEAEELKA